MKNLIAIAFAAVVLTGCGVSNSANIDFDANNITYKQDSRTGICFAVTASRKAGEFDTTGMGMAAVKCTDKVLQLIK